MLTAGGFPGWFAGCGWDLAVALACEGAGVAFSKPLSGAVGDAAPAGGLHRRHHGPGQVDRGHEPQLDAGAPLRVRQHVQAAGRRAAGVVDQDVDRTEALARGSVEGVDLGQVGEVGPHAQDRVAGGRLDRLRGLLGGRAVAGAERHMGALGGEGVGDRPPQPARPRADQRNLARETQVHGPNPACPKRPAPLPDRGRRHARGSPRGRA